MNSHNHLIVALLIPFSWAVSINCMHQPTKLLKGIAVTGIGSSFTFGMYHEIKYRKTLKAITRVQHNKERDMRTITANAKTPTLDGRLLSETGVNLFQMRERIEHDARVEKDTLCRKAEHHKRFAFITNGKEKISS